MAKQEMVRVELLCSIVGVDEHVGVWEKGRGDIHEMPAADAKRLIDRGLARIPGPLAGIVTK